MTMEKWGPVTPSIEEILARGSGDMTEVAITGKVRQWGAPTFRDGDDERLRLSRAGDLAVNTREGLVDRWTRDGRVFIANNPVIGQPETMSAAGTAITLTAPSLRFTVPSGLVVCPIMALVDGTRVITKDDIFAVIATGSDSYTSGGDAVLATAKNALVGGGRPSQVTNLHYSDTAIVEGTLTSPRLLKRLKHEGVTGEVDAPFYPEYNILKGDQMVYLIGPASFLVFAIQETTAMEAEFTMMWAELDPAEISGT